MVRLTHPSLKPYPEVPFFQPLRDRAMTQGNRVAVTFDRKNEVRRLTFKGLDKLSDNLAIALINLGVRKGDVVALYEFNSPEFIVSAYGITKAGAILTALNTMHKGDEVEHQLNDSEAETIILNENLFDVMADVKNGTKLKRILIVGETKPPGTTLLNELLEIEYCSDQCEMLNQLRTEITPRKDVAVLAYTTGTTGRPKGVMLTHFNLITHQVGATSIFRIKESDVTLIHLPLSHMYGFNHAMATAIYAGASQVIMPRFDLANALELVERYKVTIWPTVPLIITLIANNSDLVQKHDISSLRFFVSGGWPLKPEVIKKVENTFGVDVLEGYGLTEASPGISNHPLGRVKIGSVGIPYPDVKCKIVDNETGTKELRPYQAGELITKGPNVMKGYWKKPMETRETIRNGWLYTGDVAYLDEEGYIYIVDRKKDIIKYKGYTVSPTELEALLLQHPSVADCAVIGKPDYMAGEIPKAFVVVKPGARVVVTELIDFVNTKVASYKAVREMELVQSIPRNPMGKILRKELMEKEAKNRTVL